MTESDRPIALVSGGSRGIGRAAVLRLAQDGFDVAFCYQSDTDAASTLEKEVAVLGGRAIASRVDVSDNVGVRSWVNQTEDEFGPIMVVVTSAGIVRDGALVMMSDEDWSRVININLDGTFAVCRAALFPMMKRKSGCVITVSSISGLVGNVGQANYSAAKAGVIGFTKALAKEVGRYGIRANVVAPGFIETDMVGGLSDARRKKACDNVVLGRFGCADEVADAISYLVSANYVTGSVLQVDGGLAL
ncbi:SDR family oxidoreductase [Nocardia panacis]|uniref:3-oxoacyl-[acyl-carrier-protein] reductase MabA n=1 Tax=Nocardia panacis TaxID=2340916 RepID=A0A3A4L7P8_9NOCA|nr:3-oxoacyl-ACP reductase FabG [Nocardia panacis]RJO78946.1 SDR family oxidoreductase [Nocardia panacis]